MEAAPVARTTQAELAGVSLQGLLYCCYGPDRWWSSLLMQRQPSWQNKSTNRLHSAAGACLGSLQPKRLATRAYLAGDDLLHCLLPLPNRHCLAWMNKSQEALPLPLQSPGQRHLNSRGLEQDSFTESGAMQSHALAHVLRYRLTRAWSGDTATCQTCQRNPTTHALA